MKSPASSRTVTALVIGLLMLAPSVFGQAPAPITPKPVPPAPASAVTTVPAQPSGAVPAASAAPDKPPLKPEELDQLLAPIALYPDALLSQIFMASTYPLEVVEADRWVKQAGDVKSDASAKALEAKTWDASVKSLVNFPQVLAMMSEKLDWTVKLGDAFIEQQKEVMDAAQRLRVKAQAQGNLKSNDQQTVKAQAEGTTQVIQIESKSPDVIYVPTYDPVVVYGAWPYPTYPPYYYYPPGYVAGRAALSFGVGVACGLAWGYAWGNCNWGHGNVDIDINRNTNFNRNINRTNIQNNMNGNRLQNGKGAWQHDASHRGGVAYRDKATSQRYGKGANASAVQARESYRGRAEAGRQDINRGGADQFKGAGGRTQAPTAQNRAGTTNRPATQSRPAATQNRSSSAFSGSSSGQAARASSNRGSSSMGSSGAYRGGGGGARSGGGGGRGGGGRGGGGRR